jgi:ABC-type branched-subunit amino acid transport system ATPase component
MKDAKSVNKKFDGTVALDNFSQKVQAESITGIIGPNGAGKTTLFNVITGFLPPDSGSIQCNDQQLIGLPPYKIARHGIIRTFQQLRLITRLTVLDNILLAFQNQAGEGLRNIFTFSGLIKNQEQANRKKTQDLLDSLGIRDKENALVEDLSYGQQKMVSLLCCLAAGARLVLLDESVGYLGLDGLGLTGAAVNNRRWSTTTYGSRLNKIDILEAILKQTAYMTYYSTASLQDNILL